MNKNIRPLILIFLILFSCHAVWSADFGLILDQGAGVGGFGADPSFEYNGMLVPRISLLIGDKGNFYASAGFKLEYAQNWSSAISEPWSFAPELLRTEFSWNFGNSFLTAGRMFYSDPAGFAAEGLFDGLKYSFDTDAGTFSAGVWYTGFLYKKRAGIAMNSGELTSLNSKILYDDFLNTYFAPKRMIAALDWEHPGLGDLVRTSFSVLGQFDLAAGNFTDGIHTQYISGKITVPFKMFYLDFGACVELAQNAGDFNYALAGDIAAVIDLPTRIEDQLSVIGRYSSGKWDSNPLMAFLPITPKNQGEVLKAKLSGISLISLDYLARFNSTMSLQASSTYFFRNDLGTYTTIGADGYMMGNEFSARFFWNPFSDLQMNIGAGIFLPGLGNAAPKLDPLWRAEIGLILSLY